MNDIVERLRSSIHSDSCYPSPHPLCIEAADEIERLNAENARLRADAVALQSVMERMREWESLVLRDRATVRAENARLREALEDHVRAAECIRHWHDTLGDEGMVVSAEHVRLLWEATSRARAALAKKEEK